MSAYPQVFSPFRIGKVEVKNRIEFAPALSFLNPPDGYVNKEMIAFVQSLARAEPASSRSANRRWILNMPRTTSSS